MARAAGTCSASSSPKARAFPQLAEIYYREVIKRALAAVRGIVQQAIERGEINGDALRAISRNCWSRLGWWRSCGRRCSRASSRSTSPP